MSIRVTFFCWIDPFIIIKCPFLLLVTTFVLRLIQSDISVATQVFFFLPVSVSVCILIWSESCRQHIYGSCFALSIQPCLLIGAFSPSSLKVIIDRPVSYCHFNNCLLIVFVVVLLPPFLASWWLSKWFCESPPSPYFLLLAYLLQIFGL